MRTVVDGGSYGSSKPFSKQSSAILPVRGFEKQYLHISTTSRQRHDLCHIVSRSTGADNAPKQLHGILAAVSR